MKACLVVLCVALFAYCAVAEDQQRPPFLEGADDSSVKEFQALLQKSGGLTDKQIDEAVDGWVAKQAAGIKVSRFSNT